MAELHMYALVKSVEYVPVKDKYPEGYNLYLFDLDTRKDILVSSPVAVAEKDMLVPVNLVFSKFVSQLISYGAGKSFLKMSCSGVSGARVPVPGVAAPK